jgi:hypothetical protein
MGNSCRCKCDGQDKKPTEQECITNIQNKEHEHKSILKKVLFYLK